MEINRNENTELYISYDSEDVIVSMEYSDYYHVKYQYDRENNIITANIIPLVPHNLSSTTKGKIGELIGKVALEYMYTEIMELQKSSCEFDILDNENGVKYDVKFSLEHIDGNDHASYWKFCLKGDRAPKDYQEDVDFLLLIGTYNKMDNEPVFYLIPSDCSEIKELNEIRIATSGKSKYEKYRINPFQN